MTEKKKYDTNKSEYSDFAAAETMHNYLTPEQLPEGPYGSPTDRPLGKSTPFDEDQRYYSAFNYENKSLHHDIPRQHPTAHPTHDDPEADREPPYDDSTAH